MTSFGMTFLHFIHIRKRSHDK